MNLFVLDRDPTIAAQYHHNRHVLKMTIEVAQLLCTAHRILDGELVGKRYIHGQHDDILYKETHANHPCAIWVRECDLNYHWTYNLFVALLNEYQHRYKKVHASSKLISILSKEPRNICRTKYELTPFPQAMPDDVKHEDSVIAYRQYYNKYKALAANGAKNGYKNREIPEWLEWNTANG